MEIFFFFSQVPDTSRPGWLLYTKGEKIRRNKRECRRSRTGEAVDKSGCAVGDDKEVEIFEVKRCNCNAEPITSGFDTQVVEGYGNVGPNEGGTFLCLDSCESWEYLR